jgi:hypothetical protein
MKPEFPLFIKFGIISTADWYIFGFLILWFIDLAFLFEAGGFATLLLI